MKLVHNSYRFLNIEIRSKWHFIDLYHGGYCEINHWTNKDSVFNDNYFIL